ncbi:hypothetical protein OF83DRAFT_1081932 [Amylostereum chailletii]|nr:hypothetical protein OF83DRAFT_1081932 [Amylostereum chailletii]
MLAKTFALCFFFFLVAFVFAAPQPEKRFDLGNIIDGIGSDAGSVFDDATSAVGGAVTKVETAAGSLFTVVTADGGKALTLAESGAGFVTSIGASVFTVATGAVESGLSAAATHSSNGDMSLHSFHLSTSLLASVGAVAGGIMFGAWATF